jgi:hypothetical protein
MILCNLVIGFIPFTGTRQTPHDNRACPVCRQRPRFSSIRHIRR